MWIKNCLTVCVRTSVKETPANCCCIQTRKGNVLPPEYTVRSNTGTYRAPQGTGSSEHLFWVSTLYNGGCGVHFTSNNAYAAHILSLLIFLFFKIHLFIQPILHYFTQFFFNKVYNLYVKGTKSFSEIYEGLCGFSYVLNNAYV